MQAELPPLATEMVTARVGEYEVTRRLGDGEFSTVVECRKAGDTSGAVYALKAISKAKVQISLPIHICDMPVIL